MPENNASGPAVQALDDGLDIPGFLVRAPAPRQPVSSELGHPLDSPELAAHAAEIRQLGKESFALGKQLVAKATEMGRRLDKCKDIAGHGNWLSWLQREFGWSDKTAENLINVYKLSSKFENFSNLDLPISALYLLAAPSTPEAVREEIIECATNGEKLTVADVKHKITARRPPCADTQQLGAENTLLDRTGDIAAEKTTSAINVRGTQGTGENEWFTPDTPLWPIITMARAVLGEIDLDLATHQQAQKIVRAAKFYTKEDDGLKHEWHGRVWLNPPYAQPYIAQFVSKLVNERLAGNVTAAIMLTHNYSDTAWFEEASSITNALCLTHGRVKFYELNGEEARPTQGQAFFYFGDDVALFKERFKSVGKVWVPA